MYNRGGRPPCLYIRHRLNIYLNLYLYKTGELESTIVMRYIPQIPTVEIYQM